MKKPFFRWIKHFWQTAALTMLALLLWGAAGLAWEYSYRLGNAPNYWLTLSVLPLPFLGRIWLGRVHARSKSNWLRGMLQAVWQISLILATLAGLMLLSPRLVTCMYARQRIYSSTMVASGQTAIVFGAALYPGGKLSADLRERVETAAELYRLGKTKTLLMSGNLSSDGHREPDAMAKYAMELGVPAEVILLDESGQSTYDTCYRAREIFLLQQAILVTQRYHLPRALLICNHLGLDSVGVPSGRESQPYVLQNLREFPATLWAWWDLSLLRFFMTNDR